MIEIYFLISTLIMLYLALRLNLTTLRVNLLEDRVKDQEELTMKLLLGEENE